MNVLQHHRGKLDGRGQRRGALCTAAQPRLVGEVSGALCAATLAVGSAAGCGSRGGARPRSSGLCWTKVHAKKLPARGSNGQRVRDEEEASMDSHRESRRFFSIF